MGIAGLAAAGGNSDQLEFIDRTLQRRARVHESGGAQRPEAVPGPLRHRGPDRHLLTDGLQQQATAAVA